MVEAIKRTPYTHGKTNTAAALDYVTSVMFSADNGDRLNRANVIFIITDGRSNAKRATVTAARAAKKSGVHIIAMGVGDDVDRYELLAIASHPDAKTLIAVENYDRLEEFVESLSDQLCSSE